MKKIIKVFPIFVLLILSIFVVLIEDMQEKENYKNIQSLQSVGFTISNDNDDITSIEINELYDIAKEYNVYLVKTLYNENTNSVDNYITADNIVKLLSKQLSISDEDTVANDSITTLKNDDSSSYYLPDFLNNDRYRFFPIEELENQKMYSYGSYTLYYQNEIDCRDFLSKAELILNTPQDMLQNEFWGQFDEHTDILLSAMIASLFFFSLFYFVIVLFLLYRESKQIGVLQLLGFSNTDILTIMNKNYILSLIICSLIICFVSLLLPNAKFELFIKLFGSNLILIVITVIISYIALLVVNRFTDLSNILKKQTLVKTIGNVCLISKFIMVLGLILFSIAMIPMIQESLHTTRVLSENKILMDYAVFPRIRVENSEYDDTEKYIKFYQEVVNRNIDHIYVRFDDYLETDKEIITDLKNSEDNGTSFRVASVDKNYLKQYNLTYYDSNNKQVDIQLINQEFYLIPKSRINLTSAFKENVIKKYNRYQIDNPVMIYFYDDYTFDTYDSEKGIDKVASPIMRVIHESNPYTYIENSYGVDIAGTRMNTGLKFNISKNNNFYQSVLKECLEDTGLDKVLVEENFISYKNYYADEITKARKVNTIFAATAIVGGGIYIILILQTFILFVEAKKNEVLVKSILGFKRRDIFRDVIDWNIGVTLIPITGFLIYSFMSGSTNLVLNTTVAIIFIVIDLVLLLIMTKLVKINNVYSKIKGE